MNTLRSPETFSPSQSHEKKAAAAGLTLAALASVAGGCHNATIECTGAACAPDAADAAPSQDAGPGPDLMTPPDTATPDLATVDMAPLPDSAPPPIPQTCCEPGTPGDTDRDGLCEHNETGIVDGCPNAPDEVVRVGDICILVNDFDHDGYGDRLGNPVLGCDPCPADFDTPETVNAIDPDGDGCLPACDPDANTVFDPTCGADTDLDGDPNATDCRPEDPSIHHGAPEACDGRDTNCDGEADPPTCECTPPMTPIECRGVGLEGCFVGAQECEADGTLSPCLGLTPPENFGEPCVEPGACGVGTIVCDGDVPACSSLESATAPVCNAGPSADRNCNDRPDVEEQFPWADGRPGRENLGAECHTLPERDAPSERGVTTCAGTGKHVKCEPPEVTPSLDGGLDGRISPDAGADAGRDGITPDARGRDGGAGDVARGDLPPRDGGLGDMLDAAASVDGARRDVVTFDAAAIEEDPGCSVSGNPNVGPSPAVTIAIAAALVAGRVIQVFRGRAARKEAFARIDEEERRRQ